MIPAAVIAGVVIVGESERAAEAGRVLERTCVRDRGEPEVEHLDGAVVTHLDVAGLQIAMDDPLLVRRVERLGDLSCQRERFVDRQRAGLSFSASVGPSTSSSTRPSVEPVVSIQRLQPVDGADVRMIQRREDAGLAPEPRHPFGIGGEVRRQDLDGHLTTEHRVRGTIDLAHAADAEQRFHAIRPELRPNHDRTIIVEQGRRSPRRPADRSRPAGRPRPASTST